MALTIHQGADIVIHRWCQIKPDEKVLIISDETHVQESFALWQSAQDAGAFVVMITIPENCSQPGFLFDSMLEFFLRNDVIIGATNFSLITTRAVREVLSHGSRFLSLPLSSNNGCSALSFDFMDMDPLDAQQTASGMLKALRQADTVHITTALGTDLTLGKKGRDPGLFNGMTDQPGKIGSSSFEIYIGIEETATTGQAVVDGSLGYIGVPSQPIHLTFQNGKLIEIENHAAGNHLRSYMDSFNDPGIYVAGELGIGLNKCSRCLGNCYIEDESTFTTFHIGMGRNLALGGIHDAAGHFDLVFKNPTIFAGDTLIMKDGLPVV